MKTLQISPESFLATDDASKFIPLGSGIRNEEEQAFLMRKIRRDIRMRHSGVWGTLGKAENDNDVNWTGRLSYSGFGNDNSKGLTLEEIKDIYSINPAVRRDTERVIERFINFDDVRFPEMPDSFTEDKIPRIRLTLFLEPDEGAMVYYHHFTRNWKNERNSDLEYIMPEPTPGHTTDRDRLDYLFPILPDREIVPADGDEFKLGDKQFKSFVIKILVFKREENVDDSYSLVQRGIDYVRTENRYQILKYNSQNNTFEKSDSPTQNLRSDAKTLLLLHGTFSSTEKSFSGLLKNSSYPGSWLREQSQHYDQIIGFNHSTIMHDARDNLDRFRDMMGGIHFRDSPVDIITFSRGGLVGKQLACGPGNDFYPVRKAALVSCANGVGYFTAARRLGFLLRYFKKSETVASVSMGGIISLFAQHSAKFFLSRPGALQMTIGKDPLESLLVAEPAPQNQNMVFKAFSGRWSRRVARNSRLLNRAVQRGISLLTRPALGRHNDFVVGKERQEIIPGNWGAPPASYLCTHTTFFTSRHSAAPLCGDLQEFLSH